jgi:hypothetical protein
METGNGLSVSLSNGSDRSRHRSLLVSVDDVRRLVEHIVMNFCGMCGCLYTGFDCLSKGAGTVPQSMFSESAVWLWYVIGALWILNAVGFGLRTIGIAQSS